jgi:hypothetical protein
MVVVRGRDNHPRMPTPLILVFAAVAFLFVLCIALWLIAELTGGTDSDQVIPGS